MTSARKMEHLNNIASVTSNLLTKFILLKKSTTEEKEIIGICLFTLVVLNVLTMQNSIIHDQNQRMDQEVICNGR